MPKLPLILTVPPANFGEIPQHSCTAAHMAYRLGQSGLLRADGGTPPRGGLMVLDGQGFQGGGDARSLCRDILQECTARSFRGIICDFEGRNPSLEGIVRDLGGSAQRRKLTFYVPEAFAHCTAYGRIMISSALSGGSLPLRLQEAKTRYGAGRTVLAVERIAEDFFLPAPNGRGTPLTPQQLRDKMERLSPSVFFSPDLYARYFTYMSRETGAHFVLFDDGDTIRKKLELAARLELRAAILAWPQVSAWKLELFP